MRNKIDLNEKEKTVLKMIDKLSLGKGYMYQAQLAEFLVHFGICKNQDAVDKMYRKLRESLLIQSRDYINSYKIISLTHYGGLQIEKDMKKKPKIYDYTLKQITVRANIALLFFQKNKIASSFDNAIEKLSIAKSRILSAKTLDDCISYYKNLIDVDDGFQVKMKNVIEKNVLHQIKTLEDMKKYLANNLKAKGQKKDLDRVDLSIEPNLWILQKKLINIMTISSSRAVYVKFVIKWDYSADKIIRDIAFLHKFHTSVFENTDFRFQIYALNKSDQRNILDEIESLKVKTPSGTGQYRALYDYHENEISVSVLDHKLLNYFAIKI
jgi:hypothetical protein